MNLLGLRACPWPFTAARTLSCPSPVGTGALFSSAKWFKNEVNDFFSGCIESFGPHRGTARKGALAIRSFMLCGASLAVGTNMFDTLSPNTRMRVFIGCSATRHSELH
ncbi:hypothetical protein CNYM01_12934 [Colletotrichum nymphaeae SA-01]|uniref:Uncharacterized protein n=1 Tax=Colletotrichum nymphaeae SA-01 TaxID=1460502 RepID=A0A135UVP9_9PEZI|nr:hypothetical protein CNYM01_12934 [Colletotrichum nymphaeae SA-01]